jgi:hypothetical protein
MDRWLARIIVAQGRWAKPFGDFNHRWLHAPLPPDPGDPRPAQRALAGPPAPRRPDRRPDRDPLPRHRPDVLDLRTAADIALIVGILTMLAAAVAGAADYADTDGTARERATVHSTLMVVALLVYLASLAIRGGGGAGDDRTVAVWTSVVAFLILAAGAYVGGDVVYALGNMVSRHAFRGAGTKWIKLEPAELDAAGDIPEGRPVKGKLGSTRWRSSGRAGPCWPSTTRAPTPAGRSRAGPSRAAASSARGTPRSTG